ncbi:Uncharacterised protein [Acinetobacter baumannii]|nr:Uncharacterised protein [Acinetobacter baumannii]
MAAKAWGDLRSVEALTLVTTNWPFTSPAAARKLYCCTAWLISPAVTPNAAIFTGSSHRRMANTWLPRISASAIPGRVASLGWITRDR